MFAALIGVGTVYILVSSIRKFGSNGASKKQNTTDIDRFRICLRAWGQSGSNLTVPRINQTIKEKIMQTVKILDECFLCKSPARYQKHTQRRYVLVAGPTIMSEGEGDHGQIN